MPKMSRADQALDAMVGARKLRAVTPHASAVLPDGVCDALYVNDEGVVQIELLAEDDSTYMIMKVTGPGWLDVRAKAVKDGAGTTATAILAAY